MARLCVHKVNIYVHTACSCSSNAFGTQREIWHQWILMIFIIMHAMFFFGRFLVIVVVVVHTPSRQGHYCIYCMRIYFLDIEFLLTMVFFFFCVAVDCIYTDAHTLFSILNYFFNGFFFFAFVSGMCVCRGALLTIWYAPYCTIFMLVSYLVKYFLEANWIEFMHYW